MTHFTNSAYLGPSYITVQNFSLSPLLIHFTIQAASYNFLCYVSTLRQANRCLRNALNMVTVLFYWNELCSH